MNNNTEINNVALNALDLPEDLKKLDINQCKELCREIRQILIDTVSKNGGHLASNLGAVELTWQFTGCLILRRIKLSGM